MIFDNKKFASGDNFDVAIIDCNNARAVGLGDQSTSGATRGPISSDGFDEDQLRIIGVIGRLDDLTAQSEALKHDRCVDDVDPLAADASEVAALDGTRDGVGVQVDDFAKIGDAQFGDGSRSELLNKRAEFGTKIEVGSENLGGGRVDGREIHCIAHGAVEEDISDLLSDFDADCVLGFGGGGAKVGRERDVGQGAELAIFSEGLFFKDVETGGGNLA